MKVICIGNYPPRKCGIATFTENLVHSILDAAKCNSSTFQLEVIAMNDQGQEYNYPPIVTGSINDRLRENYQKAANYINDAGADICLFQHEYGIYGGESGLLALSLLSKINIPIVSTFHTVLLHPNFHQREVLKKIAGYSDRIVVMNSIAIGFLEKVFDVPKHKILQIEHGVPDFSKLGKAQVVRPKSWVDRKVMLTFGLIGRSKGIETVIKALPEIVKKYPDILYVVLGKTHPHVIKYAGEEYREYLEKLTHDLKMEKHMEFLNQYVSEEDLMNYLMATDLYVTPYLNKAQITSGTLAYAVGGGAAVVSTPYWHAEELITKERGRLFPFKDHKALSVVVNDLLDKPEELAMLKKNAFEYGLSIAWPKIGKAYLDVFTQLAPPGKKISSKSFSGFKYQVPEFSTKHLERLTDDTGLVQHARGSVADYKSGYCLDDNSRAMITCLKAYRRFNDQEYIPLVHRYLAYLMYMQNADGSFKNYLNYWRNVVEEVASDDAFGRAVWALGYLIRYAPSDSYFQIAMNLFNNAIHHFDKIRYARGFANSIRGLYHYVQRFPDQEQYAKMLDDLAGKLNAKFQKNNHEDWHWFEPGLTYDNGLLPGAMFLAYEITENPEYLETGLKSMELLESKCFTKGHLSLIGNRHWFNPYDEEIEFAQQPIDALAMLMMYCSAYKVYGDEQYLGKIRLCFEWFFGNNDLNLPLYDEETQGCNDGLEEFCINRNQGAESIIAYLMSWLIAEEHLRK